jgi:hypothetical protein
MSFSKMALSLSVAGLITGLSVSVLVTPRFTGNAVMVVHDDPGDSSAREWLDQTIAKVRGEKALSTIIQNPQNRLYKEECGRMPIEQVAAIARNAIQISREDAGARSFSLIRIQASYRDMRGTFDLINGVTTLLTTEDWARNRDLAIHSKERERELEARILQLKTRLAVLQAHPGVVPASDEVPVALPLFPLAHLETFDPPVVRFEYPNRWAFMLIGVAIGFLFVPLIHANSRRRGRAAHGRPAQTRAY